MIAGADSRVKCAFFAALRRDPYFGAPPVAPEVLRVNDLAPAIARAERALKAAQSTPPPPPVTTRLPAPEAPTGPSGTARMRALQAAEAAQVLRTDSILVLDEYAFNYPAGRLDTYLDRVDDEPTLARRRSAPRRALIRWLGLALLLPVLLAGIFVVGVGIGRAHVEGAASRSALAVAPVEGPTEARTEPAPAPIGSDLADLEARTDRFAPPTSRKSRR